MVNMDELYQFNLRCVDCGIRARDRQAPHPHHQGHKNLACQSLVSSESRDAIGSIHLFVPYVKSFKYKLTPDKKYYLNGPELEN